jgi:Zn-dependent M32 family carboxypeptidase
MVANWEIAHQEYKAFRKRWDNKNIFEYGEKMLDLDKNVPRKSSEELNAMSLREYLDYLKARYGSLT